MDAAGIFEYEKVHIVNVNSGSRIETYVIAGERGSGVICLTELLHVRDKRRPRHHNGLCVNDS